MSPLADHLCCLPTELLEIIFQHLGDTEISGLRLTCKNLRERALHRFRTRFVNRRTDLSPQSLRALVDISTHEQFSSAVENLTVVAVVYDTEHLEKLVAFELARTSNDDYSNKMGFTRRVGSRELTNPELDQARWEQGLLLSREADQPGPKVQYGRGPNSLGDRQSTEEEKTVLCRTMLTTAFYSLVRLKSCTLEAAVYKKIAIRSPPYTCTNLNVMWDKAFYTFNQVMSAIAESCMAVERLSVYGGQWGCSISTHSIQEMLPPLRASGSFKAFGGVRLLNLCVSSWPERIVPGCQAAKDRYHRSLADFLVLFPDLEELVIHSYAMDHRSPEFEKVFTQLALKVNFPRLRNCTLKGVELHVEDLIYFLRKNTSLKSLELHNITLKKGDWRPFFEYCSGVENGLERLVLHRLSVDRQLLRLDNDDEDGTFRAVGEDLKRRITFQSRRELDYDRRKLCADYGPPGGVCGRLQI